jgi:hypothetical protein
MQNSIPDETNECVDEPGVRKFSTFILSIEYLFTLT